MAFFAPLAASVDENGSDYFTLQIKIATPRKIIDSSASRTYITSAQPLTSTLAHCNTLQTATGATTKITQAGNMKVRHGDESLFLPSLACRRSRATSCRCDKSPRSLTSTFPRPTSSYHRWDRRPHTQKSSGAPRRIPSKLQAAAGGATSPRLAQKTEEENKSKGKQRQHPSQI